MFTTIRIIIVPICKAGGNSKRVSFPFSHKNSSSILVMRSDINYSDGVVSHTVVRETLLVRQPVFTSTRSLTIQGLQKEWCGFKS